jgi:hypothetical protein
MGVLDYAGVNLDELMASDEQTAEEVDRDNRRMQERIEQVQETVALGAGS